MNLIVRSALAGGSPASSNASILLLIRIPRVMCVALCGACLSLCGCAMQGLLLDLNPEAIRMIRRKNREAVRSLPVIR